jgi:hypothetical protein
MTISVAHNGSYIDDHGERHSLPDAVFGAIGMMKVGQEVLIQKQETEEENDKQKGEENDDGDRERGGKI